MSQYLVNNINTLDNSADYNDNDNDNQPHL